MSCSWAVTPTRLSIDGGREFGNEIDILIIIPTQPSVTIVTPSTAKLHIHNQATIVHHDTIRTTTEECDTPIANSFTILACGFSIDGVFSI